MALLLVDRTFEGEPIGIWTDSGESYYVPGKDDEKARAQRIIAGYGGLPWSAATEHLADSMNHRQWWQAFDTPLDLEAALSQLRDEYFAEQSAQTLTDK